MVNSWALGVWASVVEIEAYKARSAEMPLDGFPMSGDDPSRVSDWLPGGEQWEVYRFSRWTKALASSRGVKLPNELWQLRDATILGKSFQYGTSPPKGLVGFGRVTIPWVKISRFVAEDRGRRRRLVVELNDGRRLASDILGSRNRPEEVDALVDWLNQMATKNERPKYFE